MRAVRALDSAASAGSHRCPALPACSSPPPPPRETFFAAVGCAPHDEAAMAAMHAFCAAFGGLLREVHAFLEAEGLDDPAKV